MMMESDGEDGDVRQNVAGLPRYGVTIATASQDGGSTIYVIKSTALESGVSQSVDREYEDFEWLHQSLHEQEGIAGLSGVVFPPLPPEAGTPITSAEAKMKKQLGELFTADEKKRECRALENYVLAVLSHPILGHNPALRSFLIQRDLTPRTKTRKGIFSKFSLAMEEMRKENHKDNDPIFQQERQVNTTLINESKAALEKLLELAVAEQRLALACGHLSTTLLSTISENDSYNEKLFCRTLIKLSDAMHVAKGGMEDLVASELWTLGLHLEHYVHHQEAEKEMLFRRTCRLIDVENASRALDKAKPAKKPPAEEVKKEAEKALEEITATARSEIDAYRSHRGAAGLDALSSFAKAQAKVAKDVLGTFQEELERFRKL
ncbi:sorting nexin-5-like isoform X1 [Lampetra planeri]